MYETHGGADAVRAGGAWRSRVIAQADPEPRAAVAAVPLDVFAVLERAVASAAQRPALTAALEDVATAAREISGADVALVRVLDAGRSRLSAVAVVGPPALAAELEGTHLPADDVPATTIPSLAEAPDAVRRAAARAAARSVLVVPVRVDGTAATLELFRAAGPFSAAERLAAELAAGQAALVLRAFAAGSHGAAEALERPALELAGEALAAALDESHTASELVRVAASVVGAPVALLWEPGADGALTLAGSHGLAAGDDLEPARRLAAAAVDASAPVRPVAAAELPAACGVSTTLPLGQPPLGLLQLLFASGDAPGAEQLVRLTTFGVRVAHALRASARARTLSVELERTRALLAVVGQATAELSLAHTLETAVDRVAELFAVEQVAVYLRGEEEEELVPAAGSGLAGPHARVAERLLEMARRPVRGRRLVEIADAAADPRLRDVLEAVRESGIRAAVAAPLLVREDVIGLLAIYPARGRGPTENEAALLSALAGQLAVAVQNAQLHEQTAELSGQREEALASERAAAKRLRALYEISRSFAQSLSLETTLDALAHTVADVLDVDAAVLKMPDARREQLVPRAIHVQDGQLAGAAGAILFRAQPFGTSEVQRLFRDAEPFRIERGHELLEPFLEKGWTAAVVPVATPAEVIASLTILCFRPGSPITASTIEAAEAIAGQAALAIDNARLYQQQKEFADTMQRSLLPRDRPRVEGLDIGAAYAASAKVDVGGDVYDYLVLPDGRLAVVLGDVTGHGIDATADMAMAKFVFRSLAREHSEPGEFLSAANAVVVDEIATGKFITMLYLAVDGRTGSVAAAGAGHPPPRLLAADGTVQSIDARGLILGVAEGQRYEEVHATLERGGCLVLYTDGVIESRREGDQFGIERLDALLASERGLTPEELARAVIVTCRDHAGGELADDCAVVVVKRL
ncbi:MAG: hypothetical protein V7644_2724 [Actinomycetota bacterium]